MLLALWAPVSAAGDWTPAFVPGSDMLRSCGLQVHSPGTGLTTVIAWKSLMSHQRLDLGATVRLWRLLGKVLMWLVRAFVLAEASVFPRPPH